MPSCTTCNVPRTQQNKKKMVHKSNEQKKCFRKKIVKKTLKKYTHDSNNNMLPVQLQRKYCSEPLKKFSPSPPPTPKILNKNNKNVHKTLMRVLNVDIL